MPAEGRLLLGTRKGLMVMEQRGSNWEITRHEHKGVPVPYAVMDPRTETLWASLHHGHWAQKLCRSRDAGQTWQEVEAPKYPEGEEIKEGEPATTKYLWVIEPGRHDRPNRLYIGTSPGGLFQTDDGGDTWQLVRGLWDHKSRKDQWFGGGLDDPGIHSVWTDPRNSDRTLVGISCAGVFETTDDGKTWHPRNKGLTATFLPDPNSEIGQDPHLLVSSRENPDMLWQQNHCGIFRSTDGASQWQMVSEDGGPAHFGFAVATDAEDGDSAWVVPAVSDEIRMAVEGGMCVSRTTDGGTTWTACRDGLPQKDCFDIVFRHALDKAGDRLAFGTTTGNVFISEDRGQSWQTLSNFLPPIYSVRFVGRD